MFEQGKVYIQVESHNSWYLFPTKADAQSVSLREVQVLHKTRPFLVIEVVAKTIDKVDMLFVNIAGSQVGWLRIAWSYQYSFEEIVDA